MNPDVLITVGVLVCAFAALAVDLWTPDAVLLVGLTAVTVTGVIDLEAALLGFANPTLLALGSLYVVAAALRESGALDRAVQFLLGEGDRDTRRVLVRMCPSVSTYSAFLNNTPVVAMGIPALRRWGRRQRVPASKLLIPLSYAAIFGGLCTLIGTSTNLVVHGLLQSHGYEGFGFFELAWIGVPCAIAGLAYIILFSPFLTPDRVDIREEEERQRALLVELVLTDGSPLVLKTVEEAGVEILPGLRLARINRGEREIAPVRSGEELWARDRLFYEASKGVEPPVPNLADYPGLKLAARTPREIKRTGRARELHEAVVKEGSRLAGSTVEKVKFLERFGAAVTGVRRGGRRLGAPVGEVVLRLGDVLMLDTGAGFREAFEDVGEFLVTTEAGGEGPEEHLEDPSEVRPGGRAMVVSVAVLTGIVALVATGTLHVALAGMLGVTALIALRVIEAAKAREAVDWSVLLVIGAALGLGQAMEASGTAELVGGGIVDLTAAYGSRAVLAGVVVATALLTEIITNNGAVAIMFPIVISVAHTLGVEPRALFISVTLAGSMSLMTPIGYQTNLMVYGPGNYRFTDFFRVGAPLQVVLWAVVIVLAPIVWPM
jgi:di/tricarboxylate transporter